MVQPLRRCDWSTRDPIYIRYHDREWGTPLHDDKRLFEFLTLEGAQAGLSWLTVLKKRENYRKAFDNFDPAKVSDYGPRKIAQLMADKGIIRNRLKILSAINNANAFLKVQDEFGSFDSYIWGLIDNKTIRNRWTRLSQIPAKTKVSDAISKDLLKRGFRFVGSTICYSHMQATGMVNDHLTYCFRYRQLV
jgi:DNA-3-methyladenine glycosylase I